MINKNYRTCFHEKNNKGTKNVDVV